MRKNINFLMFKNYMHNELGITKEDIKQWTVETTQKTVEFKLDDYLYSSRFETLLLNKITKICKSDTINEYYKEQSFNEWIKNIIKSEIKSLVIDNIDISMDMNVKTKK